MFQQKITHTLSRKSQKWSAFVLSMAAALALGVNSSAKAAAENESREGVLKRIDELYELGRVSAKSLSAYEFNHGSFSALSGLKELLIDENLSFELRIKSAIQLGRLCRNNVTDLCERMLRASFQELGSQVGQEALAGTLERFAQIERAEVQGVLTDTLAHPTDKVSELVAGHRWSEKAAKQ